MSVTNMEARLRIERDYQDGNLDQNIIDFLVKIDGKQYFLEEVEDISGKKYVYSCSISICTSVFHYEKRDLMEMLELVPRENLVSSILIGEIEIFYPRITEYRLPEDMISKRDFKFAKYSVIILGFDGTIWIYTDDCMYLASKSFDDFILMSPKNHLLSEYILKFSD